MNTVATILTLIIIVFLFFLISEFFGRRKHIGRWWTFILLIGGFVFGIIALIFSPSANSKPTKGNRLHIISGFISLILLGIIGMIPFLYRLFNGIKVNGSIGFSISFILLGVYLLELGRGRIVNKKPKYYFLKKEMTTSNLDVISFEKQKEILIDLKNNNILSDEEYRSKLNKLEEEENKINVERFENQISNAVNEEIKPLLQKLIDLKNANLLSNDEFEIKKTDLHREYKERIINNENSECISQSTSTISKKNESQDFYTKFNNLSTRQIIIYTFKALITIAVITLAIVFIPKQIENTSHNNSSNSNNEYISVTNSNYTYKRNSENVQIDNITKSAEYTVIQFTAFPGKEYSSGWWVNFNSNSYIEQNGKKYYLKKAEGIPLSPNKHYFSNSNETLSFKLYFDKSVNLNEKFDLIEFFGSATAFNFYYISK
jgi:hypothetical protein